MLDFQLYLRSLSQEFVDFKQERVTGERSATPESSFLSHLQNLVSTRSTPRSADASAPAFSSPVTLAASSYLLHNALRSAFAPTALTPGLGTHEIDLNKVFAFLGQIESASGLNNSSEEMYVLVLNAEPSAQQDVSVPLFSELQHLNEAEHLASSQDPLHFSTLSLDAPTSLSYQDSLLEALPVAPGLLVVANKGVMNALKKSGGPFQYLLAAYHGVSTSSQKNDGRAQLLLNLLAQVPAIPVFKTVLSDGVVVEAPTPVVSDSAAPAPVAPETATPAPALAAEVPTPVVSVPAAPAPVAPETATPAPEWVAEVPTPVVSVPAAPAPVAPETATPAPELAAEVPTPVVSVPAAPAPVTPEAAAPAPALAVAAPALEVDASELETDESQMLPVLTLPLVSLYWMRPLSLSENASDTPSEDAFSEGTVFESGGLQQNIFLYRLLKMPVEKGKDLLQRQSVASPQANNLSYGSAMSVKEAPMSAPESPFVPVLQTWVQGALKMGRAEGRAAQKLGAAPALKIESLQTGTLSTVLETPVAPSVATPLAQKSMTFSDFMSFHELFEASFVEQRVASPSKASSQQTSVSTAAFASLNDSPPAQPGLSFSAFQSPNAGVSLRAEAPSGLQYVDTQAKAPFQSLPPELKPHTYELKPLRGDVIAKPEISAIDEPPSIISPRVNLSASQVIQAINQNIPIHIADFPAFVSRVLQVQPPALNQPQSLQVTLSPDALGKITAKFELTAQNTVNITLLSQSGIAVNQLNTYLQEIQQIVSNTQFTPGQIVVRQGIPMAKQSQSFEQQSHSDREAHSDQKLVQRRGGQRRRRSDEEEISIDVTV